MAVLVVAVLFTMVSEPPNVDAKPKGDSFSALAYLPTGAGPRMIGAGATANLTINLERYTTDEEAKQYAATLLEKGPDELLKALEHRRSGKSRCKDAWAFLISS